MFRLPLPLVLRLTLYVLQLDDPRLDCAILRPMKSDHDSFLAYYLTQDDESAVKFKQTRFALNPYEVAKEKEVCCLSIDIITCIISLGNNLSLRARLRNR
jgi:hypothetical protein